MKVFSFLFPSMLAALLPFGAIAADDDGLSAQFQQLIGNTSPDQEDWSLHAQATDVLQGYPSFPAAYSGANSLSPQSQSGNTVVGTIYLGRRLWQGGEFYFDRELYEGKGLEDTLGLAGFPNGEANKSGSWPIKTNDARVFLRQVIGLGGAQEQIAGDQNQLAGKEDISRITLTVGKFAATDLFDNNSFTHDPGKQFMNWALMDSAAWDYPANARGYTDGAAIELNQEKWALRYGIFMEPDVANQSDLTWHGFGNLAQVAELEERYTLAQMPGKLRVLAFMNENRQAYLDDVLGAADVNAALLAARHYGDVKYGFALNGEQQLTDSIGAFARLSWNNGETESWMFTDVSESAAGGLSINGKSWGRPDDTWGIAGVVNGLSGDERKFFEQGGQGILIGDGRLSYSPETIFETYYAISITRYATFSPDYQFVLNPAYNTARGPVNVFAARLHVEF